MSQPFTPRPYQYLIRECILLFKRFNIWLFMGAGKTAAVISGLVMLAFVEKDVFPALVLAPLRVANNVWPAEQKKWTDFAHIRMQRITGTAAERKKALRTKADIYTMNYENMEWLIKELGQQKWPFKTVIADECFPSGAPVATPGGSQSIEDIRIGDTVATHLGYRRVVRTYSNLTDALNLVYLKLSNGKVICVTENHPFFTDKGWLPAGACRGRQLYGEHNMPYLRGKISSQSNKSEGAETAPALPVLRPVLPYKRRLQKQPRFEREGAGTYEEIRKGEGREALLELRGALERRNAQEDVRRRQGSGAQTGNTRGKWYRDVTYRGVNFPSLTGGFLLELYRWARKKNRRVPVPLQIRFWKPRVKNRVGSGWQFTYPFSDKNRGQKENSYADFIRVEDITHHQQRGVGLTFNLEVEGASTFFAHGVLVHNCTKLKGFRLRQGTARARALSLVAWTQVTRFYNLTGTPVGNGLKDLWGQNFFIDKGERLGRSYEAFKSRWFQRSFDGYSIDPLPFAQEQIQAKLADICISLDPKDYFDIKDPILINVYVDLPPEARKLYNEMEKKMFIEIEKHPIEAFNAAARTNKLAQLCGGAAYIEHLDPENKGPKDWRVVHDVKIEALEEIIEESAGAPVLVAYEFKSDLARLKKAFPQGRIFDKNPQTERDWNTGKIPVMFLHPKSAAHGVSLQDGGNILIFFSSSWNLEEYLQIIERIGPVRQLQSGHDRNVFLYFIMARDTIDEDFKERRETKKEVQDVLLEAMKRRLYA